MRITKKNSILKLKKIFEGANEKSDLEKVLEVFGKKTIKSNIASEDKSTFDKILEGVKEIE